MLIVAFGVTAPFAAIPLPRVDGFIAALETVIMFADLTTFALLLAQFCILSQSALLVLASGYLLTSLIVVPHALSFPGAFTPEGLLGNAQTTAWLYHFWKVSLPVTVIVYVLLKDADIETRIPQHPPKAVIGWGVGAVILIAAGLTWLTTAGQWLLPSVGTAFLDLKGPTLPRRLVGEAEMTLIAIALALLWHWRRSVLDVWLMVMCFTLLLEIAMAIMFVDIRYSVGFYASRFYSLIATAFVLLMLLSETTVLYAHLARAEASLRESERQLRKARDELETKVAERTAELRRSEAYLAEAERLSHIGTWAMKDRNGERTVVYWAEESYRIYGLDPLHGIPTHDAVWQQAHPDDRSRVYEEIQEALRQRRDYLVEFRILLPDGTVKYLETIGHHVFSEDGELLEVMGVAVDVTERKRAQEEHERLRQLEADLAHMNRLSTMGELAASLAHEITQPIGSARNDARAALNFLDRQPPDLSEVREALACVVGDADRAGHIIDRIRDHTKKAPPRKHRFDLNEATDEVIGLARSAIAKNGVSVRTHLAQGLFPVHGDRVQLQQVILNLVLNAVEAMSQVEAGTRELLISTEKIQANGVLVTVRDFGPGIDPERIERVFEAFYSTKTSGMGMGLSICRSIIEAHRGRLWAGANEPRGAVFQFTLPGTERSS
jgi:PAS domain S-box-containing protein